MKLRPFLKNKSGVLSLLIGFIIISFSLYSEQALSGSAERNQRIEKLVESFIGQTKVPGSAVLVAQKGKVVFKKSYGLANIEQGIRVSDDTAFAVGSITKQFTGLAIAQLITAGKLSLDDPLHKFFPDYPERGKKITVRNLLNHTSGLTNYTLKPALHASAWKKHSHADMMAWFKDDPLVFEPGSRWNYTNSGIYLLGVIIEKITGLTYAEYLQQNIFTPFDMGRTYVAGSKAIIPNRAAGYDLTEDGYKNARSYDASVPFSAGTIISTTGDLWKYLNNVHRLDLVSEDIRKIIYKQEVLPDGQELHYTLGCLFAGSLDGRRVYSHAGEVYGFYADSAYYPEEDITVIILTNRMGYLPNPPSLSRKISREVIGIKQPKYSPQPVTETDKAQLAGNYHYISRSFFQNDTATVSFADDMLIFRTGPTKEKMFPLPFFYSGNGRYIMAIDDEFILKVDAVDGHPTLYLHQGPITYKLTKDQNR